MPISFPSRSPSARALWIVAALASVAIGVRYIATEPLIFEPGGWFALDGRRVLDAGDAFRAGLDPYAIHGFLYTPVAVVVAGIISALPHAMVLVAWISASAVAAGVATWRELTGQSGRLRAVGVAAVLLFIPTIADLVLANVTIALVVAAWIAIRGGRVRSGIALGLLAAAFPKPFLIPIALWLLVWRPRSAVGAVISGAIAVAIATLAAGIGPWGRFVETLASGGGLDLGFVGNYGVSAVAPSLAIWVAIAAAALFLWLLVRRRDAGASLAGAAAAGIFVAPYAGIYAALPLLLAARDMAAVRPRPTAIVSVIAVATAPWALVPGALTLLLAGLVERRDRAD